MLLDGHVGDSQKCYIDHSKRSKDVWDELRQVHIGKRRLISMLRRLYGYKSADESVDRMASFFQQPSNEIQESAPASKLSGLTRAIIITHACKGDECKVAKYSFLHEDMPTPELTVDRFRNVEQYNRKPKGGTNVAKGNRCESYTQQKPNAQ